jgi:hypothetical protein
MCVRLCVRRRFRVLIDAMKPARTAGFWDRKPARTVGFQKREPVRTENGRPDRAGRGRGAGGRAGSGRGQGPGRVGQGFEKTGFGRTGGQTGQGRAGGQGAGQGGPGGRGQGRGTHGGLHSGLRPQAPTSIYVNKDGNPSTKVHAMFKQM